MVGVLSATVVVAFLAAPVVRTGVADRVVAGRGGIV